MMILVLSFLIYFTPAAFTIVVQQIGVQKCD